MKIIITGLTNKNVYSGGRFHAWMMAEALANSGHEVTFWTNNIPKFINDISILPKHKNLKIILTKFFLTLPKERFDLLILIPDSSQSFQLFISSLLIARKNNSKIILLNFETPNWYNELSPVHKDPSIWKYWFYFSKFSDLVLSISKEGTKYAKKYYLDTPKFTLFKHCYPTINELSLPKDISIKREKQIICMIRFHKFSKHKGTFDLINVICEAMRGYTLAIMIGFGQIADSYKNDLLQKAQIHGVEIQFLNKLTEKEKYIEIRKSCLMLYLSYFEGFGYPPIEAQYCNTPCIVYDLPVLREVNGDGVIYVEPGDFKELHNKIEFVLEGKYLPPFDLSENISRISNFDKLCNNLDRIINELFKTHHNNGIEKVSYNSLILQYYLNQPLRILKIIYDLVNIRN